MHEDVADTLSVYAKIRQIDGCYTVCMLPQSLSADRAADVGWPNLARLNHAEHWPR